MTRYMLSASLIALASAATAQVEFDLGTISVATNAAPLEADRTGASTEILTSQDIAQAPATDLSRVLLRLPGVSLSQTGPQGSPADLRIRGTRPRYLPVYIDGILVTDPSGTNVSFDDFGGLGTANIGRVELLKGSQSALYGSSAVGGVLDISTAPVDAPEGFSGKASVGFGSFGTTSASTQLVNRSGAMTLWLGLSHDAGDGFSAAQEGAPDLGTPGAVNDEADGFERRRLSFGASYEVSADVEIGLTGFTEDGWTEFDEFYWDDQDNNGAPAFNFGDDIYAYVDGTHDEKSTRKADGLRLYLKASTGIWDHSLSLSRFRIDRQSASPTVSGPDSTPSTNRFKAERLSLTHVATAQVTQDWRLSLGADAKRETVTATALPGGSAEVTTLGAFAEALWSPSDSFDVTATVRRDTHSRFGNHTTRRLAFAWRPAEGTTIRGAAGTGFRAPSIDELFGEYPSSGFVGNPDLAPETSVSYELGVDHEYASGARFGLTAFQILIEDLVTYRYDVARATGTLFNAPGTTTREGVELSFNLPFGDRLEIFGTATFLDTDDGAGNRLARVPGREYMLGVSADLTDRFSGSVTARRVTHRPADRDAGFNPVEMDAYTLVDMQLRYDIGKGYDAYLNLTNLTDERYQIVPGYGTSPRAVFFGINASF